MSFLLNAPLLSTAPPGYQTPPWPSLYFTNLFTTTRGIYLYHTPAIWRFTLYWTLIFFGACHFAVAFYALFTHYSVALFTTHRDGSHSAHKHVHQSQMQGRSKKKKLDRWDLTPLIPVTVIVVWGMGQAVVAGSLVGGLLGAVYETGGFRMSTWIPVVWAGVCTLVVVLRSFSIQGGL